jgi:hypothetical protein
MRVPSLVLLAAAFLVVAALSGCGGKSTDTSEETFKRDAVASCLERAGATNIKKSEAGDFDNKIAASGALEGAVGNTKFALVFEPDVETARSSETLYAGAQGGSWQKGVLLDVLLKRSHNVVLAYERAPTDNAADTVEGCIGDSAKIDPDIAEQFGR